MPEDSADDSTVPVEADDVEDVPTVSCARCDREWDLEYELEEMSVGNLAVEQFALDHRRHTGHFPDGISTWDADCRHCPEAVQRLEQQAARRWAETHARHTRHTVAIDHVDRETPTLVDRSDG